MGGNKEKLVNDAIPAKNWMGYFEIHIEQGPVLYEKNIPVAVVTGIAAQKRIELIFSGIAGHAGTVPMNMRYDALCAAAECIIAIENFSHHQEKFVATIGKLDIHHSASNVIPGRVTCSLDLRSIDEMILSENSLHLSDLGKEICRKRNIGFEWNIIQETRPVHCDTKLNELLKEAIAGNGHEVMELVSGAGHDAVAISQVAPVAMLFVRCFKGISHNPLENVEKKDIAAAIKVSDAFLVRLKSYSH
jgi:allantoate deiminase